MHQHKTIEIKPPILAPISFTLDIILTFDTLSPLPRFSENNVIITETIDDHRFIRCHVFLSLAWVLQLCLPAQRFACPRRTNQTNRKLCNLFKSNPIFCSFCFMNRKRD